MMTSVWVPVITALAALLGVVVGQAWQARREQRRWKWERELDAVHREEQRQRDREMWAREDRNRFTEQKRQIYVDYQTCAYRISVLLVDTSRRMREVQSSGDGHDLDSGAFLDSLDFATKFAEKYDDLKVIRNHIRIMAPAEVVASVTRIDQVLIPAIDVFYEADPQSVRDLWISLRSARLELFDTMRRDLDPEGSLLTEGVTAQFITHDEAETWPS
jgi:hypothetical protein